MGAWVETLSLRWRSLWAADRSLRGSVSWNSWKYKKILKQFHRSLRGSVNWNVMESLLAPLAVGLLPTWERELKHQKGLIFMAWDIHRSLHGSVNWNCSILFCYITPKIRSLHGSLNWNRYSFFSFRYVFSLPTWERELKRVWATILLLRRKSLPVWERELKPSLLKCFAAAIYYRFLHGSVSWNSDKTFKSETLSALMILRNSLVAPYVGACVEINVQY